MSEAKPSSTGRLAGGKSPSYIRAISLPEARASVFTAQYMLASDVAYVGDRPDNDVRPAAAAGMRAVWIRRGPWGIIEPEPPPEAALSVASLTELVAQVDRCWIDGPAA